MAKLHPAGMGSLTPFGDALAARLRAALRLKKAAARRPDEPAVHALRLELRALEPLLEVARAASPLSAGPRKARKALRALLDATGPLRDSQLRELALRHGGAAMAAGLRQRAARERKRHERACRRALRAIKAGSWRGLLASPLHPLDQRAVRKALRLALQRRRARLRQRIEALRPGDAVALHRARVALKRYRSLITAFESQAGPGAVALLPALKRLQRRLGDWHDARLRAEWLRSAAASLPTAQRRVCEREARGLLAACAREEAALIRALRRLKV